ncbi:TPA: hypothetical protein ACNHS6_000881 [Enterococcus faecalis]|uniref:hypothetical protein n=1 Tax=Enterococcus faecalis TaxID=1351 RepID=UPI00094F2AFF|nr:hypothetical protein [Enterococcus faecalis]EGO2680157.1 hypothetical protein [Enterococcus faecalis]EGO7951089.1 hypothetical protein [Enterococcus faecalis]EGO8126381.1 hypothetical protein [Enterococcus faecalis]EGO8292717.1 hypothetical protein [Enterococcus faecalis]EGO8435509.1 hypothetical protein [Enterococcus faecalis]
MYDSKNKTFYCDVCKKVIKSGEKCWTKWQFPPKANAFQDKAIKSLEYQNASIICLECQNKVFSDKYKLL